MARITSVEEYLEKHKQYHSELQLLRETILETELEECIKWGAPVYTLNGKNVVGLGAFKNHFGVWFFNGVFLSDPKNVLFNAQEGKTKALRQLRYVTEKDIDKVVLRNYLREAIQNQKDGKELIPVKKSKKVELPKELSEVLNNNAILKTSFFNLAPYKQREYAEFIESAKREATKQSRIDKIIPLIEEGIGLNDKYKNC